MVRHKPQCRAEIRIHDYTDKLDTGGTYFCQKKQGHIGQHIIQLSQNKIELLILSEKQEHRSRMESRVNW